MTQSWALRVPLLPDELLSTWLTRAALRHGCDPLVLTGDLWPGWRAWTVDLDRGLSPVRLQRLSARSGLLEIDLEAATMRPLLRAIVTDMDVEASHWPWLLALGSRNRSRRGGLQFCPQCLYEDAAPYYRRRWRLAWHVGCERHSCMLWDRCPDCERPVEPHRLVATDEMTWCAGCRHDLRRAKKRSVESEALALQRAADAIAVQALEGRAAPAAAVWLASIRRTVGSSRSLTSGSVTGQIGVIRSHLAVELLGPQERQIRLVRAWRELQLTPEKFHVELSSASTPEISRPRRRSPAVRSSVPTGVGHPLSREAVQGRWARLRRRMGLGAP